MSVKAEEMTDDTPIDKVQVQENLWSVSLHNLMRAIGMRFARAFLLKPIKFTFIRSGRASCTKKSTTTAKV